ncbi:UDP-N-acetylmuramoyl-L-alanyl-D-glutamate--2,6-diaminopimelate ligase [Povalibacter sp.]|uniref:UDP-N-acetylmuramoyl-L-alanyl-D-glutamate--2, 6-diaminopimelate ligase n=1 Tax=Povalibacter sp. TaxID=1962978 RepID=UPI002F3E9E7B
MNIALTPPRKNLRELLAGLVDADVPDVVVADLTIDSRKAGAGSAFVALPGLRSHGVAFASQAVGRGATVVLWQPAEGVAEPKLPAHVTVIAVTQLTAMIGTIADRFFSAPSRAVAVTGVTGTNGKTTIAYVLAAAFAHLGKSSAYAGTLGYGPIGAVTAGTHTTPDCITLHRQIAALRDAGVQQLAMEVSSHALDQRRVAGVRIDTAVFTNLTHDHLDYHGSFEAYGAAKARLFAWPGLRHAVINVEDAFGRELAANYQGHGLVICARDDSNLLPGCGYVLATSVTATPAGLVIGIDSNRGSATLHSCFVGDFNVDNLIAVLAVLLAHGFPMHAAVSALESCAPPPGRMETFVAPERPLAIVDYAHTPDALEKALSAARKHCSGKLICVFGCGGDRDAAKRPVMGAIAERLADVVMVTDDNPRTEDGNVIVAAIVAGLQQPQHAIVERDRARAIERAITIARAGDVVLVAGKGHEDYQIVGHETRYFSDRDVVQAALGRNA